MKLKGLSLFSNVGIAETYLDKYIDMKVANELIEKRANFYKELYPNVDMITGDITNPKIFNIILEKAKQYECDFILATPPCQGMSIAGKMDENDPRNSLIIKAVDSILFLNPKYFLIENVAQMPKTFIKYKNQKIQIKEFIENSLNSNYNISFHILDAADYGVPQTRKRSFILGSRKDMEEWKVPPKTPKKITVREAIGHLPSLESGETSNIPFHYAKKHNDNHILWMRHTPTGQTAFNNPIYYPQKENGERIKGYSTTYKRIEWDKPAPTITMCNGAVSSQNNVHPGRLKEDGTYSDARVLSLKEIFILSSLPDDWTPPKWASDNLIRQVIGEGVPPKLVENLIKNIPIFKKI